MASDARLVLSADIEGAVAWRNRGALGSGDRRSSDAAVQLHNLAHAVRGLPENDPLLQELKMQWNLAEQTHRGEQVKRKLSEIIEEIGYARWYAADARLLIHDLIAALEEINAGQPGAEVPSQRVA